ncbi:MAG: GTPase domain-containing protein [Deltaproteobacteria bacterium]|nr:GTPase domain-containing protein [Deltaproteobacteria bacterium]
MSFINYDNKEINFKVVYVGPGLSGKTTSLEYIYIKTKGKSKAKMVRQEANERTLFFDFIPLFLSEVNGFKTRFHAYTVPGQVLYEDSRNLILKGVDGIVFVADSAIEQMEANIRSLEGLKESLQDQGVNLEKFPIVFQYNKRDAKHAANLEEMRKLLNTFGAPDFESIATKGQGVFEAFKELAKKVLADFVKTGA